MTPGSSSSLATAVTWDVQQVRRDFPMLERSIRGHPISYLDNAATALKPLAVTDAMTEYYRRYSANVQRGVHQASQEATERFEAARARIADRMGAAAEEVVFTAGTTAAINLVASSWGGSELRPGDEILVTEMEHHSNIVPWQLVAERVGATITRVPITDQGELDLDRLRALCSPRARLLAFCHVSNVLGTIVPVREVCRIAREAGVVTVVDGAQAIPHLSVDVAELGCDFYAFSGHKAFGPTGVGVLFGRKDLLAAMAPWQGGGGMIASVDIERSSYAAPPARFEAGTPPIAEVLGLGAAIDYMSSWDRVAARTWEDGLVQEAIDRLSGIPGVRCFGPTASRVGVVAFVVDGIHPHDVGTALDDGGVAVRAGHHCAQPLMQRLGVTATVRASFAPYNTAEDVDALVAGVERARKVFGAP